MLFWIFCEAAKNNGGEHWWAAPVYNQAKIAFRRMRRSLTLNARQLVKKINESSLRIELWNGSAIEFKSAEKSDNLYGEDVRAAVIDEASRMRDESWYAIRSTLTATSGRCKIIGNVKGRKNWFYLGARKAEEGEEGHAYYKLTSADNPYISKAEIEDAERVLPKEVFEETYLAIPCDDGGNPFGLDSIARCVTAELSSYPVQVYGVDLGRRIDYTVIIGLDQYGAVCFFQRWRKKPWKETRKKLSEIIGATPALVDSTGVGDPIVEDLQEVCSNVEGYLFTPRSKQELMEGLQVAIQTQSIYYPNGPIRTELETFEYEYTRTGVKFNAPSGMHDDCVCALALGNRICRRSGKTPQVITKSTGYKRPDFDDE